MRVVLQVNRGTYNIILSLEMESSQTNKTNGAAAPDLENIIVGNIDLATNADSKAITRDANGNIKMRGGGRLHGAKKIDSIYKSLDNMQAVVDLLESVKSFTEATATATTADKSSSQKELVAEAIDFSTKAIKEHIACVGKTLDNTAEKRSAGQAHSKCTKKDRYAAVHTNLELERAMKDDPMEALAAAIKMATSTIDKGKPDEENMPARPSKKQKIVENQLENQQEVHVPPPANNALIYQTYEAAQALKQMEENVERLSGTSNKNTQRCFKRRFKDEMINRGYVPLKKSALNDFAAAYAQQESPAPPPFWNMKGRREYMSIDDLRAKVTEKRTQAGGGGNWSLDDTEAAIFEAKKARAIQEGKDPDDVKKPEKKTISAYHAALRDAANPQI